MCFGILILCGCQIALAANLTLAVHPFKPATQLMEAFTPLAAYLSNKLGDTSVTLRIAPDYQTHVDAIGRDEVDIAYMGPVPYVKLIEVYGVKPLLARQAINGSPLFHGKIFVAESSSIQALAGLRGKRFAFTEPLSTMGHLVPRSMLREAGVSVEALGDFKFVGDHINAALSVLAGEFDAGAVKEDVFFSYEARGLRAIATSPPISDHLFVAGNQVSAIRIQQLRDLLFQLSEEPNGKQIMSGVTKGVTAFVPTVDADFDSLRALLKTLAVSGVTY